LSKQLPVREIKDRRINMQFGDKTVLHQETSNGPSACIIGDKLYVAWRGTDDEVNVGKYDLDGNLLAKVADQQTQNAPQLFTRGDQLYVAWTGTDGQLNFAPIPDEH
jgi:hypothetical protein